MTTEKPTNIISLEEYRTAQLIKAMQGECNPEGVNNVTTSKKPLTDKERAARDMHNASRYRKPKFPD